MVKAGYVDKNGLKKGAWSDEEDDKLRAYIVRYGHWNWKLLPKFAGLYRCGKSCRLRWMNYLKPGIKRGSYSKEEEDLIVKLHQERGSRWSAIAEKFPGRTDNDIKNYWHTHLKKDHNRLRGTMIKSGPSNLEKSDVVNILESSSTSNYSSDVHGDGSDSSEKCPEIYFNSGGNYDGSGFSNSFDGFHEDFWTKPLMVETDDYNKIWLCDEGGFFSPPVSFHFDDNGINMLI